MRVGILSYAHMHAEAYISNLQSNPATEFIGLADDDPARGQQFAGRYDTRLFDSYDQLLNEKPDAVVICSENTRHLPLVQMAAEAGAHVLCEKPLAATTDNARQIVDICEGAGVQLMTAFPMRFSVPTMEMKKTLDKGQLGTLYGCNTTNQGSLPTNSRNWFVEKDLSGGGALIDHTVHVADVLRWYMGCEVTEVYAQVTSILHPELAVETAGLVMLTFENGCFASIDCSWSRPPYYPTWGNVKIEIVGENGLLTLDAFKQGITVYSHQTQRPAWHYWGSDSNQAMVDEFIAACQQNRVPSVTGYDGYKATEIVEAAYRSVQERAPVRLPLD